jgi:hypothetical protein
MTHDAGRPFYRRAYFVVILVLLALAPIAYKAMRRQDTSTAQISSIKASEITEITLRRGVCLGDCPAYKVTFRNDGSATYAGEAYSPLIGLYKADSSSCPQCYFAQLASWIDMQAFFNLQDVYHKGTVDAGSITITVVYNGKTKTVVSNDPDSPIELWGIAMAIDGVVSRLKWKKV